MAAQTTKAITGKPTRNRGASSVVRLA